MTTVLNLDALTRSLTREQFIRLCQSNPDLQLERSHQGELVIVSPVGGESGNREATLITKVGIWNEQTQLGFVFSSSTIFSLPNGGDRSPDVAWVAKPRWQALSPAERETFPPICPDFVISKPRWQALSPAERETFPPICPDFVIELRSRSDRLQPLQAKMQEYLASGLKLGWLINPQDQQVEIYRPNQIAEVLQIPTTLSGEDILPGFSLAL